jgi:hypothetical protein
MAKEYRKREEGNELIKRFEDHLRKKKAEFFDLDAYEQIIDHYMLRSKHNKAFRQSIKPSVSTRFHRAYHSRHRSFKLEGILSGA